jgi:hypothetical protein
VRDKTCQVGKKCRVFAKMWFKTVVAGFVFSVGKVRFGGAELEIRWNAAQCHFRVLHAPLSRISHASFFFFFFFF